MISIIIPVYNEERYIEECLKSVFAQTYTDYEVVVINDGSTDNTLKILEKYTDRIRIINKNNGGLATALNRGVIEANGEWIKILPADDLLYPDCLMDLFINSVEDHNAICYSNYERIDEDGNLLSINIEPDRSGFTREDYLKELMIHFIGYTGGVLMSKQVYDKVGFYNTKLPSSEDYEFWLRAVFNHGVNMKQIDKTTMKMRLRKTGLTATYGPLMDKQNRKPYYKKYQDLVSIIIPVYNCESFIKHAIESALKQEYDNVEIIVVDDGSTDNTEKICLSYPVDYYKKENGGTASALNYGIKKAKGKWIKWLSADDVLYPDAISLMMSQILFLKDMDKVFYTNYEYIDFKGRIDGHVVEENRNDWGDNARIEFMRKSYYANGSTWLLKKEIFDKCGLFDESLPYFEDKEFLLRLMVRFGIFPYLLKHSTVGYRIHAGQISQKLNREMNWYPTLHKIQAMHV